MKKIAFYPFLFIMMLVLAACSREEKLPEQKIQPIPFTQVTVTDPFWGGRLETNRLVTVPYALDQCESTGRLKNFRVAGGLETGTFNSKYPFDDSDVFKILEGASYSLQYQYDPVLDARLDTIISWIAAAQEEDGYLYTYRTILGPEADTGWAGTKRWEKTSEHSHELYNIGHMYEAAIAHYNATGKRNFLDVALKSADLVCADFGAGKRSDYPGHQEIEIGLVKLYKLTGEEKYLKTARFFLETRKGGVEYNQSHLPVEQQKEAVGHAVRAMYMYSGMADVAALTDHQDYLNALYLLWQDVVYRKLYVTGGVGAVGSHEGFGEPYMLPNESAYCETCAGIANVLWNERMFLINGEAKYIDVLEKTLYNNVLSGVSLEGDRFFYSNPLESHGQHERSEWFACACCPSNICRFIPSVPRYIYARSEDDMYVNLYISSSTKVDISGEEVTFQLESGLPANGTMKMVVKNEDPVEFTLHLRIPGWAKNKAVPGDLYRYAGDQEKVADVLVNGDQTSYEEMNGYIVIKREWHDGDKIEAVFPMEVRAVIAHPEVEENSGKIAVSRGPFIYCAEWADNPDMEFSSLALDPMATLVDEYDSQLPGGTWKVMALDRDGRAAITFIPYYAWAHRGPGDMIVWIPLK